MLVSRIPFLCIVTPLRLSQLDQGCVIPCPTAEDITKRGVPPMSPPLAMWEREAQVVELEKGESGLGFSILDYQVRDMPLSLSTNRIDWNRLQSKNISVGLDRMNTKKMEKHVDLYILKGKFLYSVYVCAKPLRLKKLLF